jgi:hypothetical protein
MSGPRNPVCDYVGMMEDEETTAPCGHRAIATFTGETGARHFACANHLASVRAHYPFGTVSLCPAHAPARPYPEALL